MKFLYIFAAILICACSALAQNCSTQLAMNTALVSGNITANSAAMPPTITVNLMAPFTSGTGYATIYTRSTSVNSFSGSYPIISGNGTTQLILNQAPPAGLTAKINGSALANGSFTGFTGFYISDLALVKNSGRSYTISWTTPGFNSTTNLSYGDDADTGTIFAIGYNWVHQDTTTGVQMHSVTINNLDSTVADNIGKYFFTVWSECFTAGMPDRTIGAALPNVIGGAANQGNNAQWDQVIQLPTQGDYQLALDTFTLQGFNGASTGYVVVPQQDGIHPGYRVSPGGTIPLGLFLFDDINPSTNIAGAGDGGGSIRVEDWYGMNTGLLSLGKNGTVGGGATPLGAWSGGSITIRRTSGGGSLTLNIPANAPTTGTGCTNLMGDSITLDDGTPACAYPLSITAYRWFSSSSYTCGTQITCGPTGTLAQTPKVNLPYVGKVWAIVFNVPAVSQGTVGPWINPYTGTPGIPCEKSANKNVDKPASSLPAAGCQNQSYGLPGISGGIFTFDTNEQQNCEFNGLVNENTYTVTSTPVWFYDNPYVCHRIDVLYPQSGGVTNDSYEKHILGIYWQQSAYPRTVEATMAGAYAASGPAVPTNYPFCTQVNRDANCATLTIPVGTADVSAIASGLAAGQRFRACVNLNNAYTRYCYVFPEGKPTVTPVSFAGGNITPGSTNVQMLIYYTASPVNVYGYNVTTKNVTVDATCPTSGNCSVRVPTPPQITNAVGYDVYARVNNTGTYYRQNTSGPVPIGQDFYFGTTANPFITTGGYAMPVGNWGANPGPISNVLAADPVNHTITIDTQAGITALPSNTNGANIAVMRQFTGIVADATSNTSTVVCASCDFSLWDTGKGIPSWATVYCGVTPGDLGPFPNYALYSLAPIRGSTIAANGIDAPNHTIHLTTPINCGPGVNFEIRQEVGLAGNTRIFLWPRGSYDVWQRFGNYIGADAVMWLGQDTAPPGFSVPAPAGSSAPNGGVSYLWTRRRESALAAMGCQMALHLLNDLSTSGNTTALGTAVSCQSASTANLKLNNLFTMIDLMTDGNNGRGASVGSFLDGLVLDALINWWLDPLTGVQSNPSYLYWAKRLIDTLWNTYYNARASWNTAVCPGLYPHEYAYDMDSSLLGICASNNSNWWPNGYGVGSSAPVADYWSIYGNIYPAFAFFYAYTGNALIPNSNPPTTYGAAYADMASWGFVHMASLASFVNTNAGLKTLGEMGIWQDQALGWMSGSTGIVVPPPTPLTITTSSLPAGTVGVPYAASVTATGGTAPYTWTSTGLPGGLTMNTSGNISGSPLTAGTSSPTFTVTDSVSATASTSLALTIAATPPPPLVITSNSLPSGTVGIPYSASLTATGGTPPYTWTQVGLPSGLVMNSSGNISGTPLVAGNVTPQFTVTDAASVNTSTSLSLAIAPAVAPSAAPGFTPPIISERRGRSDRIGLSN